MDSMTLFSVRRGQQLSVFLDNRPGALARLTEALGEHGINIYALSLTEGIDHGYARIVPDRPAQALEVLHRREYLAYEREVLLLEISNTPGALARVAKRWGEVGVNVEYAYCAGGPDVDRGLIAVMVEPIDQAEAAARDMVG
jgi:hypothetical protein